MLKPFRDSEFIAAIEKAKNDSSPDKFIPIEEAFLDRYNLKRNTKSKYIEQAQNYVIEHYTEDITIGEVAEHLGLSEGYLSRLFKRHTDYTFINYLTYYRVHMAMKLLKDCRWKIYEVAERVGYTDTTYFSTLFKKLVGISPSEFQDRC
ncbi:AraC family transcriptional regulator [Tissierellaceae bacterium HCP3S3_D8]